MGPIVCSNCASHRYPHREFQDGVCSLAGCQYRRVAVEIQWLSKIQTIQPFQTGPIWYQSLQDVSEHRVCSRRYMYVELQDLHRPR